MGSHSPDCITPATTSINMKLALSLNFLIAFLATSFVQGEETSAEHGNVTLILDPTTQTGANSTGVGVMLRRLGGATTTMMSPQARVTCPIRFYPVRTHSACNYWCYRFGYPYYVLYSPYCYC